MKLKKCPCCESQRTTKNSKFLGRMDEMLWFDCVECRSTFVLRGTCHAKFIQKAKEEMQLKKAS
jgi:transposase-like protein